MACGIFHCGRRALCCGTWASLVAARGLHSSCGVWALEHVDSVVAACGILVPRPGIEPASPALEGGFLTTGPPGKSQGPHFLLILYWPFT